MKPMIELERKGEPVEIFTAPLDRFWPLVRINSQNLPAALLQAAEDYRSLYVDGLILAEERGKTAINFRFEDHAHMRQEQFETRRKMARIRTGSNGLEIYIYEETLWGWVEAPVVKAPV